MKLTKQLLDIINVPNDSIEPIYNKYKDNLVGLNAVIDAVGEPLEGNLFYLDRDPVRSHLFRDFLVKRRNYAILAAMCDAIVEIGFNAGHSALLALSANDKLIYRGIDANYHSYTKPCYDYLKQCYGDRISVELDISEKVMPEILNLYPELTNVKVGWIIDGNHDVEEACKDIINVLEASKPGDIIMFDDASIVWLRGLITAFVVSGEVEILYDMHDSVFLKKHL